MLFRSDDALSAWVRARNPRPFEAVRPDTDAKYKDIDSRLLLRDVARKIEVAGFHIGNVDATIIAQAPKMAPHIAAMTANIAADLALARGQVNVKATTTERLGFAGRGEGIAAQAVVLLEAAG